jgi:hypothetical protein
LKPPGFNPRIYEVKNWFRAFAFEWVNLYRYDAAHLLDRLVELYKLNAVDP